MTPQLLALIVSLIEQAVSETPVLIADFKNIFGMNNPTPADWEALRAKVLAKGYGDYVPASALLGASKPSEAGPPANVIPLSTPVASDPPTPAPAPPPAIPAVDPPAPPAKAPAAPEVLPYLPDGSRNPAFNHLG